MRALSRVTSKLEGQSQMPLARSRRSEEAFAQFAYRARILGHREQDRGCNRTKVLMWPITPLMLPSAQYPILEIRSVFGRLFSTYQYELICESLSSPPITGHPSNSFQDSLLFRSPFASFRFSRRTCWIWPLLVFCP
jgi:hypothetical protein